MRKQLLFLRSKLEKIGLGGRVRDLEMTNGCFTRKMLFWRSSYPKPPHSNIEIVSELRRGFASFKHTTGTSGHKTWSVTLQHVWLIWESLSMNLVGDSMGCIVKQWLELHPYNLIGDPMWFDRQNATCNSNLLWRNFTNKCSQVGWKTEKPRTSLAA